MPWTAHLSSETFYAAFSFGETKVNLPINECKFSAVRKLRKQVFAYFWPSTYLSKHVY